MQHHAVTVSIQQNKRFIMQIYRTAASQLPVLTAYLCYPLFTLHFQSRFSEINDEITACFRDKMLALQRQQTELLGDFGLSLSLSLSLQNLTPTLQCSKCQTVSETTLHKCDHCMSVCFTILSILFTVLIFLFLISYLIVCFISFLLAD